MAKTVKTLSNKAISAIAILVNSPFVTNSQLAEMVGVTIQQITNWRKSEVFMNEYDRQLKVAWADAGRKAQKKMQELMEQGDYKATEFILKSTGLNPAVEVNAQVNEVIRVSIEND